MPPPIVPTSIEGIDTAICKLPSRLIDVSEILSNIYRMTYFRMVVMQLLLSMFCAGS